MSAFIQRQAVVQHCGGAKATLALLPLAGCAGCERQRQAGFGNGHCGVDLLGLSSAKNRTLIEVSVSEQQALQLTVGSEVSVQIPTADKHWLSLALQVYGYPTLGLMVGAVIGSLFSEWASVALSVVGLCTGLWLGRRFVRIPSSMASLAAFAGPITRIVENDR